jgi:hypothetical protein
MSVQFSRHHSERLNTSPGLEGLELDRLTSCDHVGTVSSRACSTVYFLCFIEAAESVVSSSQQQIQRKTNYR